MDSIRYSQPDFYKFNQDSLNLVNISFQYLKGENLSSILDIGAGSGVVGIEYYLKVADLNKEVHFLEVQKEFIPHLKENIKNFKLKNSKILNEDMYKRDIKFRYDLILCNPPYFIHDSSRQSPNHNRNKCRMITRAELSSFFKVLKELSSNNGYVSMCIPNKSIEWELELRNSGFRVINEIFVDQIKVLILQNI